MKSVLLLPVEMAGKPPAGGFAFSICLSFGIRQNRSDKRRAYRERRNAITNPGAALVRERRKNNLHIVSSRRAPAKPRLRRSGEIRWARSVGVTLDVST